MIEVRLNLSGVIVSSAGEIALGPTALLLRGIAATGSLQGAARQLGVSYRTAWGQLVTLEAALGQSLAVKTKGHGSILTPVGASLLAHLADTQTSFAAAMASGEQELAARLSDLLVGDARKIRLAASHDPILIDIVKELGLDIAVMGSHDAVQRLLAGAVDAAGFHAGGAVAEDAAFPSLFGNPAFAIHPLYRREQGLMLAPGNPLGIASLGDIVRSDARVVNRQRGSGTRAWFDRLLAQADLPREAIRGYGEEEFTHQAVAAVVAAGAADTGMGVRIVAERFGLDFLPLGDEVYYLAARADDRAPAIATLVARCRATVAAGYNPA
jgi:putative molybdopterin biosynthesis protein